MAQDYTYILNENPQLYVTTIDEMLEGYINNMDDDDIDRDIKLFTKFAKTLGIKNFTDMVVFIDQNDDIFLTNQYDEKFTAVDYMKDTTNGVNFYFFRNENDCGKFIYDFYQFAEENGWA